MAKIVVRENESLDDALRRFKRAVSRDGTLAECKKREFYVKHPIIANSNGDERIC